MEISKHQSNKSSKRCGSIPLEMHADLTQRALVNSVAQDWIPSPQSGVEKCVLERGGKHATRATSLVRMAPGSTLPTRKSNLGEEVLVLEGVFSCETGDLSSGTYARIPQGSDHAPSSAKGAVIMVKLRQMDPHDKNTVHINTQDPSGWQIGRIGERVLPLFVSRRETVSMLDWEPGCSFATQTLAGGAEYLVLDGQFEDEDNVYKAGTWLRLPAGSRQTISTKSGARIWRKLGHLAPQTRQIVPDALWLKR